MKKGLYTIILCVFYIGSPLILYAQSELEDLIVEREKLYDSYDYLKDKKSSFFGTQSKKDLKEIIGNLKGIIMMDSEIISAIKRKEFQQKNDLILTNRNSSTMNYDLESELVKHKRLSNSSTSELKALKEELQIVQEGKFKSQLTIFILLLAVIGLASYTWKRRKR